MDARRSRAGFTGTRRGRLALLLLSLPLCALAAGARQQTEGDGRHVSVRPAVAELPARSKRYALVVGVDDYADTQIGALGGAANDARLLAGALVERAGFPAEQVILLASGEPPERQPTRGQILRRLSNLASAVPRDGLLLFSFAGHGIERGGRAFLLPSDAQLNGDVELLEQTAVEADWVRKRIEAAGVRQVLMLLDACRDDPTGGRSAAANALTETYRRAFNFELRNRGVEAFATIYATAVGGRAYEYGEKGHGYFTWALVEGLRGGAADARGEVTLAGLLKYVQESVPRRVALDLGPGREQRPFADISGYRADDLVIAATSDAKVSPPAATEPTRHTDDKAAAAKSPEVVPPASNGAAAKGTRSKEKAGRVLFLTDVVSLKRGVVTHIFPDMQEGDIFWQTLSKKLVGYGVSTSVISGRDYSYRLRRNEKGVLKPLRSAVVIDRELSLEHRSPYLDVEIVVARLTLKAYDGETGEALAQEEVTGVRGFGNTPRQAVENALAAAGEKVSEDFIKRVIAAAR